MTREIMRKFAPSLLVTIFSDVEAAHFGSYAMHLSGIRTADRLAYQLWQEVQTNPDYRDKTTLIIMPEFGRDPDGSSTNGFFNHRADDDSTRDTWMMALGAGVDRRGVIERPIRHIDLCPTLAGLLGCRPFDLQGASLPEFGG
jgi:arylsulfatase A-like enzyme